MSLHTGKSERKNKKVSQNLKKYSNLQFQYPEYMKDLFKTVGKRETSYQNSGKSREKEAHKRENIDIV